MPSDYRILLCLVIGGAAIIYGTFSFPALTAGGVGVSGGASGVNQAEFDAAFSQEMSFCLAQPEDINCQCFANLSGNILVHKEPRVIGAVYADKQELARGQAAHSC